MNAHELLLTQVGESLGLPLIFDENEQCTLMLDNKLMFSIHYSDTQWVFYCMLAYVPNHEATDFWRSCLLCNLRLAEKGMGSICYETDSGALLYVITLSMPATGESVTEFIGLLADSYESVLAQMNL